MNNSIKKLKLHSLNRVKGSLTWGNLMHPPRISIFCFHINITNTLSHLNTGGKGGVQRWSTIIMIYFISAFLNIAVKKDANMFDVLYALSLICTAERIKFCSYELLNLSVLICTYPPKKVFFLIMFQVSHN